jgi:hypothetical protein
MESMDSSARVTFTITMHFLSLAKASNANRTSQRAAYRSLLGFAPLPKQMRSQPSAQNSRLLAISSQAGLPLASNLDDALKRAAIQLLACVRVRVTHSDLILRRQEPEPYWQLLDLPARGSRPV